MMKLFNAKLIKQKYYTTHYFSKSKQILENENANIYSTMQFKCFSLTPYMVCGTNEILSILSVCIPAKHFENMRIYYRPDGDIIQPGECVLSINGPYLYYCEFENLIDGILARRSSVATNCWKMLSLIKTEQLIFMSDRSDDYQLLPYDGYAAYVAGVRNFSNKAHTAFINDKTIRVCGTMPHALIHQFNGDIVAAYNAYIKIDKKNVIMLIDFDNDVLQTLSLLKPYFSNIHGVRIDTSKSVIDKCLLSYPNQSELYGVNHLLIEKVREYLDKNNGQQIKIVISSGLDYGKVSLLKRQKAPVDSYGIGSSLTSLVLHFTADLVKRNNKLLAKFGRQYISEDGMRLYVTE